MARAIVADVLSREKLRKESLLVSQNVFELRAKVKEFKRKTNMRGDDEDLYDSNKVSLIFSQGLELCWFVNAVNRPESQIFRPLLLRSVLVAQV